MTYNWKRIMSGEKRCIIRSNPDLSQTFIEEGTRGFLSLTDINFAPPGEPLPEIGPPIDIRITPDLIRAEAARRIGKSVPDWKQFNLISRGVELVSISLERKLSKAEDAEQAYIQTVWSWIKSVRDASNSLEVKAPQDYVSDKYWPGSLS